MTKTEQHIALYRKYRPGTFKDVAGQSQVTDVLAETIKNETFAHAYLFAGSRGTGKTTVARIFAREIGTSDKDIYEMDAASNRKIDDFRELNESVHTLPFDSKYKVYIIDEVHMLTKEAFNAFLKTLEEPPAHVVFILATTETQKLPDTIVSRCQSFTFKTPTRSVLAQRVAEVAKSEGFTLERSAADLIAILAEGSFRDALGILQKVLGISKDKKVDVSEVEKVTGAPKSTTLGALVAAIARRDAPAALAQVASAVEENIDMHAFMKLLLHRVRTVLLLRVAPESRQQLQEQFSEEDFKDMQALAAEHGAGITSATLARLLDAYAQTPHAYIKHLPLELALVELLGESSVE